MNDEQELIARMRQIEALFAGSVKPGDAAAQDVVNRIRARIDAAERDATPVEYRFSLQNRWSRDLFVALLRRYKLRAYRYRGQRHTTVMVRVPKRIVDEMLWPEFQELNRILQKYLDEVTRRVIERAMSADVTVEVINTPLPQLPGPNVEMGD